MQRVRSRKGSIDGTLIGRNARVETNKCRFALTYEVSTEVRYLLSRAVNNDRTPSRPLDVGRGAGIDVCGVLPSSEGSSSTKSNLPSSDAKSVVWSCCSVGRYSNLPCGHRGRRWRLKIRLAAGAALLASLCETFYCQKGLGRFHVRINRLNHRPRCRCHILPEDQPAFLTHSSALRKL